MASTATQSEPTPSQQTEIWSIDRLIFYARNPRKNDAAVDRMCASVREFGFEIPVLARSDGEVVDGHLRLKAARKLGITEVPVILCDDWTPAQSHCSDKLQPQNAEHGAIVTGGAFASR
jgi:hypothetical protein